MVGDAGPPPVPEGVRAGEAGLGVTEADADADAEPPVLEGVPAPDEAETRALAELLVGGGAGADQAGGGGAIRLERYPCMVENDDFSVKLAVSRPQVPASTSAGGQQAQESVSRRLYHWAMASAEVCPSA
jgi:hypothetical protein